MKKLIMCAAIASAVSVGAYADYEAELGLTYSDIEETDAITLSGELFFDSVDTSKGPHSEASFLDKASGVMLTYSDVDGADDNPYSLSGRFVTSSDLIIEAGFTDFGNNDQLQIGIGTYLTDTSDIVISYVSNDEADTDTLTADYHNVSSLGGGASLAYSVAGSYVDASNENGYGLGGDITYYPTDNFGFGASAALVTLDDNDTTNIALHADYFITPDFHIQGLYSSLDNDAFSEDIDTISIGAFFRF